LTLQRGLVVAFVVVWSVLAWAPHDRATWALENALVLLTGVALVLLRRQFVPSRTSAILLFVFLVLHEVGAHYTYSEVPYEAWLECLTGIRVHGARNHFDRVLHFGGGFLLTELIRELIARFSKLGFWGTRIAAVAAVMSASLVYELIEWGAAASFGEGVGAAYLGTQGDQWDAQKDMALASLGGILTALISAFAARKKAQGLSSSVHSR
jgi:putative membrane protein